MENTMSVADTEPSRKAQKAKGELVFRTPGVIRINHWINVACVLVLLTSGMTIFNAHPRLYWGQAGSEHDPAFFDMGAQRSTAALEPETTTCPPPLSLAAWHTCPCAASLATSIAAS